MVLLKEPTRETLSAFCVKGGDDAANTIANQTREIKAVTGQSAAKATRIVRAGCVEERRTSTSDFCIARLSIRRAKRHYAD
jgi:hypothetical protein